MYGKVLSASVQGINGQIIEVEIDLSRGLPLFHIVGLPDSSIREAAERVRAAIKNCQFEFPMERVTVNLAPADVRKEGSSFDLAIAVGILATSGQLNLEQMQNTLILGELALDGALRPVTGVISMIEIAKKKGLQSVILPALNLEEAQLIKGIPFIPLNHLNELKNGISPLINDINDSPHLIPQTNEQQYDEDYADVCGQHHAKRALMIAAAGMHNIILIGPPGSGKTMLIRRLNSILPPLSDSESLEVTKIFSVAGKLPERVQYVRYRPFRSPHHTVSAGGLIGGGSIPKPGEVSLAHRGILFLDELPEFPRSVLEVLRQPLEDRCVTISRTKAVYRYPAHFVLAASMNPCPCGFLGSKTAIQSCTCSPIRIQQYRARISGPLLDRIDLHVEVPRVDYETITKNANPLSSSEMKTRIDAAIDMQKKRYETSRIQFNSELSGSLLRKHCTLQEDAANMLQQSFEAFGMSVRAYDRILKIARTIADLEACETIALHHLAEAIQYRTLDKTNYCV